MNFPLTRPGIFIYAIPNNRHPLTFEKRSSLVLTSILRLTRQCFSPLPFAPIQPPFCVPEWSEPMAEEHASIWWKVKPYTFAGVEPIVALCQSIAYLENHGIPGAIVECGVGKGGGAMASALALLALDSTQRQLYLYDLFAGTTALAEVKQAMMQTRYPWEKLIFVPRNVEESLPRHAPEQIGLLRLTSDRYESTYHELKCLYPRLASDGILMVDQYGQGQGAMRAADTYFREQGIQADLRMIDASGRLSIKCSPAAMMRLAA